MSKLKQFIDFLFQKGDFSDTPENTTRIPPVIGDTSDINEPVDDFKNSSINTHIPDEDEKSYVCKLTIFHKDGGTTWYKHKCEKNDKLTDYYRDFYKWFVTRPQSQSYTFYYRNGFTVFTRDMIKNIEIRIEEGEMK